MTLSDSQLMLLCVAFIREQSAGEWGEKVEMEAARKLFAFVKDLSAQAPEEGQ